MLPYPGVAITCDHLLCQVGGLVIHRCPEWAGSRSQVLLRRGDRSRQA